MGTHARVVAAEGSGKVAVAHQIIGFDSNLTIRSCPQHITSYVRR